MPSFSLSVLVSLVDDLYNTVLSVLSDRKSLRAELLTVKQALLESQRENVALKEENLGLKKELEAEEVDDQEMLQQIADQKAQLETQVQELESYKQKNEEVESEAVKLQDKLQQLADTVKAGDTPAEVTEPVPSVEEEINPF